MLLLAVLPQARSSEAQPAADAVNAVRVATDESIPLDATVRHSAWQRAQEYRGFVEREPVNGAAPAFETGVRVLFDQRAIHVAIRALDPRAEDIRAPLVRHDYVDRTQDSVTLYIDAVGRRKAAQFFRVNAAGSTADGVYTSDDDNEDFSPDFDFDAVVLRDALGYTAVFRIPFAALRYNLNDEGQWRILVSRNVPREDTHVLVSTAVPMEAPSFISTMQPMTGLARPADDRFLQLRPSLTMRTITDDGPGTVPSRDRSNALALELKWRALPELVIDATINPDFSQVELDVAQLARNTRFALYYPEKRPFFLESSDLLRTPTDALYTRTVTRPNWGLRGSLRGSLVSGTAFGGYDAGGGEVLLPGTYGTDTARQPASSVAAVRLRADTSALVIGATVAARRYEQGRGENTVLGPDFTWQANDSLRLRGQWLGSYSTAVPDVTGQIVAANAQTGSRVHLSSLLRTREFESTLTVEDTTARFRNDSGFVFQSGVTRVAASGARIWRNLGVVHEFNASLTAESVRDRAAHQTVSSQVTPGLYAAWGGNSEATVEYRGASRVRVDAASALLQERYWHLAYSTTPAVWAPMAGLTVDAGRLADVTANTARDGQRITVSTRLRPLSRLEVEPSYTVATLRNGDGRNYRESAARLLAVFHVAPGQAVRLITQQTSLDRISEPLLGVAAEQDATRDASLVYAWRRSASTVLYLGASRGRGGIGPGEVRSTEVFAKLQVDVDEVRRR